MRCKALFLAAVTLLAGYGTVACGGAPKRNASEPTTAQAAPAPAASAAPAPPTSPEAGAGIQAYQAGDTAGAKKHFEAAVKANPNDADARYYLGLLADQAGDKKTAEDDYLAALKIRPDLDNASVNLGALYIEADRLNEALLVTRQGLARNPKNPNLHLNLAVALATKGDMEGATRAFEEATRLAPQDPVFQVTYAHWLAAWKRTEDAQSKLRSARPLAENNVDVLGAIAKEMRLAGDAADCVPTLDKAIALKDTAELRYERGLCKVALHDEPGALSEFQSAVSKAPDHPDPHYWLAGRYAALEKWNDVISEYETYLKLAPKGAFARQAQERIALAKQKTGATSSKPAGKSGKK